MSFKESDAAMPPSRFLKLEDDGDTVDVVFVGEPVPRKSMYHKAERTQFCFPVMQDDGSLVLWTVGVRLYIRLRDGWEKFHNKRVRITRHGVKDDQATRYDFESKPLTQAMVKAMKGLTPSDLDELFTSPGASDPDQGHDIPI